MSLTSGVLQGEEPSKLKQGSENGKKVVTSVLAGRCNTHSYGTHVISHHEKAIIESCIETHAHK